MTTSAATPDADNQNSVATDPPLRHADPRLETRVHEYRQRSHSKP